MRRSLTPKQRQDMWSAQRGRCANPACKAPITLQHCIAEHTVCVANGNDQKPDCLLCIPCADRKTNGTKATTYGSDKHEIAKVKRLERQRLHGKSAPKRKLASRGFNRTLTKKFNGEVVPRKEKAPGQFGDSPGGPKRSKFVTITKQSLDVNVSPTVSASRRSKAEQNTSPGTGAHFHPGTRRGETRVGTKAKGAAS